MREETERFFDILRELRADGVTILLITHKLAEIMAVCDAVSVMRVLKQSLDPDNIMNPGKIISV